MQVGMLFLFYGRIVLNRKVGGRCAGFERLRQFVVAGE